MRAFYMTLFGLFSLIILQSNAGGRADVGNSGATLAPGDGTTTCASSFCHGTNNFNPDMTIEVFDMESNPVTSYMPGVNYTVRLTTNTTGSPVGYGFQMLSLDGTNAIYNGWDSSTLPSQSQITTLNGRDYFEHSSLRSTNTAEITWTAPEAGTGDISFYGASLAANGNGNTGGDGGTSTNIALTEAGPSSTSDITKTTYTIYPNPTSDEIRISYSGTTPKDITITISDIKGNVLLSSQNLDRLSLSTLESGIYIAHIITSDGTHTTDKVIKL